jgi:hypothetical protein
MYYQQPQCYLVLELLLLRRFAHQRHAPVIACKGIVREASAANSRPAAPPIAPVWRARFRATTRCAELLRVLTTSRVLPENCAARSTTNASVPATGARVSSSGTFSIVGASNSSSCPFCLTFILTRAVLAE